MRGDLSLTFADLSRTGVLQFGDGYRTSRAEHAEEGYRILRVADVSDGRVHLEGPDHVSRDFEGAIGQKRAIPGDILLTTKGTVGRVAVFPNVDDRVVYSPQLCYFRVSNGAGLESKYLRYWFKSSEFTEQAGYRMNNTDMAPYISLADIKSLRISLPPIQVQRAIAEVLGALDDKIAANVELVASAESYAVALLSEFVAEVPLVDLVEQARRTIDPQSVPPVTVAHFSLPAFDQDQLPEPTPSTEIKSAKLVVQNQSVLVSKLNPQFPRVWDIPARPTGNS